MFCIACGTPLAAGLSYCNRCGTSLKQRTESKTGSITAFLTAITLIGLIGLGIMLGGAMTLKREANLHEQLVGIFMLFTFLTVVLTEVLLFRQFAKFINTPAQKMIEVPQQFVPPSQLQPGQAHTLAEPIPSVTENTTRTLAYSRNEPLR